MCVSIGATDKMCLSHQKSLNIPLKEICKDFENLVNKTCNGLEPSVKKI